MAPTPSSRSSDTARNTRSRACGLGHREQELRPVGAVGRPDAGARGGVHRLGDALEAGRPAGARSRRRRRSARSGGRSGRRRRCRSGRRARPSGTRTPCACSSRARAPAAGRARSRCRRRRAAAAPRRSAARSSSESRSTIFGAPVGDRPCLRRVPVERPQRVDLDPRALLGVEDVGAQQVVAQLARVLGAAARRRRCWSGAAGSPRQAEPGVQVRRAGRSAPRPPPGRRSRSSRAPTWACWR